MGNSKKILIADKFLANTFRLLTSPFMISEKKYFIAVIKGLFAHKIICIVC